MRKFMRKPVLAGSEIENRDELIDYIDEKYNTRDGYQQLEDAISELGGSLDDSGDEGIYEDLSTQQLVKLKHMMDGTTIETTTHCEFTNDELELIRKVIGECCFSRDAAATANMARRILQKLYRGM